MGEREGGERHAQREKGSREKERERKGEREIILKCIFLKQSSRCVEETFSFYAHVYTLITNKDLLEFEFITIATHPPPPTPPHPNP